MRLTGYFFHLIFNKNPKNMENTSENESLQSTSIPSTPQKNRHEHRKIKIILILFSLIAIALVSYIYLISIKPKQPQPIINSSQENKPQDQAKIFAPQNQDPIDQNEETPSLLPASSLEIVSYPEPKWPVSDKQVSWIQPQKLPDLKIFPSYTPDPNDRGMGFEPFESSYYLVGHINTGKYKDADVITALYGKYGTYYTLLKRNGSYTSASLYQNIYNDTQDFAYELDTDSTYIIDDLRYPSQINSPTAGIFYESPTVIMSLDPNDKKPSADKKMFTDPVWGDVYDESDGGYIQTTVGIMLPNGQLVSYSMGEIAAPEKISLGGNRTLADYTLSGTCGRDWTLEYYPDYYKIANLQQIGTIYRSPVYEIASQALLKTLYTNMRGDSDDPYYPGIKGVTFQSFAADHPLLIWADPFGRKIAFINKNYAECLGGMGKPVIYLYPQHEENVSVKVQTPGPMTASIPAYNNGWNVSANPDSIITDLITGKQYPYLFWESEGGNGYSMPKEGFNVAARDLHTFFESTLAKYGLNQKERSDFEEFWVPRLESKKSLYYFITFTTTEKMQRYAPLSISPKPDTLIRVFMDYKLISNPIAVKEPQIITPERNGFTAIEWGGALK
jgi:hypothetical protein